MGWLLLREIMTTVYFAKRCKSDRKVIDERNRPLTDEGVSASYKVMEILKDKKIDVFISRLYKRSFDSVKIFFQQTKFA